MDLDFTGLWYTDRGIRVRVWRISNGGLWAGAIKNELTPSVIFDEDGDNSIVGKLMERHRSKKQAKFGEIENVGSEKKD